MVNEGDNDDDEDGGDDGVVEGDDNDDEDEGIKGSGESDRREGASKVLMLLLEKIKMLIAGDDDGGPDRVVFILL